MSCWRKSGPGSARPRAALVLATWLALPLVAAASGGPSEEDRASDRAPNVVLVLWDGLSERDLLGASRDGPLAELAGNGALVRAHVPLPRGPCAQRALLASRWPRQSREGSLPTLLADAGFATLAAGRLPDRVALDEFEVHGESIDPLTEAGRAELLGRLDAAAGERPFLLWWAPAGPKDAMEDALRAVVDRLRELGELERTLFVLLDDRDPGGVFERGWIREERLRTPMVFAYPGRIDGGRVLEGLAVSLDVAPTVLDFVGVPAPASLAGRSLRPSLEHDAPLERGVVHGVLFRRSVGAPRGGKFPIAVYARTPSWKYVLFLNDLTDSRPDFTFACPASAGEQLLFDLEADPDEAVDLSGYPQHAKRMAELRAGLRGWWKTVAGVELPMPQLFAGPAPPPEEELPNIVLLVADDADYTHFGFMGSEGAHTPTLDSLAEAGVLFEAAYVSMSRCRPSLATLLSGRYPHQNGVYDNKSEGLLARDGALPELLKRAGYATFLGGKFWEFSHHSMGFLAPERQRRNQFVREDQDELFAFLERHAGRRPFFVWWAPLLPHGPFDAPEPYVERVADARIEVPERLSAAPEEFREQERTLYAMGAWFDAGLRDLCAKLRELEQYDDTLFVFLVDNGWANDAPSKGSVFEKGLRTPLLFSWAGGLDGGRRIDSLHSTVDLYPTLLDYAGIPVPASAAGTSLRPRLEGRAGPPNDLLCGAVYAPPPKDEAPPLEDQVYALWAREGDWKYVLYLRDVDTRTRIYAGLRDYPTRSRGDENLFLLSTDPLEEEDLSALEEHAALKQRLRGEAVAWWRRTGGGELDLP